MTSSDGKGEDTLQRSGVRRSSGALGCRLAREKLQGAGALQDAGANLELEFQKREQILRP